MIRLCRGLVSPDLGRYLTMLQRAERFSDGTWAIALRNDVFEMLVSDCWRRSFRFDETGHRGRCRFLTVAVTSTRWPWRRLQEEGCFSGCCEAVVTDRFRESGQGYVFARMLSTTAA